MNSQCASPGPLGIKKPFQIGMPINCLGRIAILFQERNQGSQIFLTVSECEDPEGSEVFLDIRFPECIENSLTNTNLLQMHQNQINNSNLVCKKTMMIGRNLMTMNPPEIVNGPVNRHPLRQKKRLCEKQRILITQSDRKLETMAGKK